MRSLGRQTRNATRRSPTRCATTIPGELAADTDLAIDQLAGPVYYRVLVTGRPVPPSYADTIVDSYLCRQTAS